MGKRVGGALVMFVVVLEYIRGSVWGVGVYGEGVGMRRGLGLGGGRGGRGGGSGS